MKLVIVFLLFLSFSFCQSYYFPSNISSDTLNQKSFFSDLASKVLNDQETDSTGTFLKTNYHLKMLTGQYSQALKDFYSGMDKIVMYRMGIKYELDKVIFAEAKMLEQKENLNFNEAFRLKFFENLKNVPPLERFAYRTYFETERYNRTKKNFDELLSKYSEKDSLNLKEAKKICQTFNVYFQKKTQHQIGKPIVQEADNKFFEMEQNLLIDISDTVQCSATIVRPKSENGKIPAIIYYNIYADSVTNIAYAQELAFMGYLGVVVNTRGKTHSKNTIRPFEYDAEDAYKILDYVSNHKWCDGTIGMLGGSYLGFSQWAAVKSFHPALKTIVPQVSVGFGVDFPKKNNIYTGYMLYWIKYVTNNKYMDREAFINNRAKVYEKLYKEGIAFNKLDSLDGKKNPVFQKWLKHPSYDEFWTKRVPYKEEYKKINIPILTTTGYFDADQLGAMYYFKEHMKYNPEASHYLLIGPYDHGAAQNFARRTINSQVIDSVANMNINDVAFEWFDYVLKGKEKPAFLKDKINYQVMGTNTWRHCSTLDEMNDKEVKYYFSNVFDQKNFRLVTESKNPDEFVRQEVDLKDRSDYDVLMELSYYPNKEVNPHVVTYLSDTLSHSISYSGGLEGELSFEINKKDFDVYGNLYGVNKKGEYTYLSSIFSRASYARDDTKRNLIVPGEKTKIPIARSFMISKKIEKGSRLAFVIGVFKAPGWQINYGTGKDVSTETIKDAKEPLEIKWFNDSFIKVKYRIED